MNTNELVARRILSAEYKNHPTQSLGPLRAIWPVAARCPRGTGSSVR